MQNAFKKIHLEPGTLQISGELDTVTVRGGGPVRQPLVRGVGTIGLDLTWTGVGRMARDEHEEGERFRRATATGAVQAGSSNFTPEPSVDATITEW